MSKGYLGGASGTNSAVNELDDLFGSIKLTPTPNIDPLEDCLPLFPSTNNVKTNLSSSLFDYSINRFH